MLTGMGPLLPEFDAERGARLWVAISGDQAGLAALAGEIRALGAETREHGKTLTVLLPATIDIDPILADLAVKIDRVNAARGREVTALLETGMMPVEWEQRQEKLAGRLGNRFHVVPADCGPPATADTILLTASRVFGSGLHPSTRLVVQALDELVSTAPLPARILDVGTGSGLLAMIAAKMGAAMVLGIDIEPEAVTAARKNVTVNGLEARVGVETTLLGEVPGTFDLILANLTASVQLRLAEAMLPRLAGGGELIVSGLQGRQQEEMTSFWRKQGLEVVASYAEGKWRALRLRRG